MQVALLGRKVGMTQVYDEAGVIHPVTVVKLGPCQVLQVRTPEKDGYHAIQLGFDDKTRKRANRAERGHVAKINAEPKKFIREVRLSAAPTVEAGAMLTVDQFAEIPRIDAIANMKGRGQTGVMKRHNFSGLETTHGVLRKHRAGGSIGSNTSPGRVRKGQKMAGRYGNTRVTVQNLKVVRIDKEANTMLVEGSVPGPNGGYVIIQKSRKLRA